MLNVDVSFAKKKRNNNSRTSDLREIIYIIGKSVQHSQKREYRNLIDPFEVFFFILEDEKKTIVN
jgi:tRNA A37 N6-isopentenylltransferase MiaA